MSDLRNSAALSGRTIVWGVAAIITVGVLAVVIAYATGFWSDSTAERRGQTGQREQTQADGTYRIARYDLFFDRCNAIVAAEGDIEATRQSIADSATDPTQKVYDRQNLAAQQANRRQLVAAYNADSAKEATAGQFRDSNLPSRIDPNGSRTSCTAG